MTISSITHADTFGSCKPRHSLHENSLSRSSLYRTSTGLHIVNIEDRSISRRASAAVPASPQQGDRQASQFASNPSVSYSQLSLTPTNLQTQATIPTSARAQLTSNNTIYQYPQTTIAQDIVYHSSPGFAYSATTPDISQTWVGTTREKDAADGLSMAATLLQQPQHAFTQLTNHYHPGLYSTYTGIHATSFS